MKTDTVYQFKTPFEHFAHYSDNKLDSYGIHDANGNGITRLWLDDRIDTANIEDTARLFATAPELLELVKQAFERFTDNDMQPANNALSKWLNAASAAIAKATARP